MATLNFIGDQYTFDGIGRVVYGVDAAGNRLSIGDAVAAGFQTSGVSRLLSSTNTTNSTLVKASAGTVLSVTGFNTNASARYLKLYSKATAPTVGTDVPLVTQYLEPQSAFQFDVPYYFSTGIGFALTTGSADNDTGAVGAGDILALNVAYR